MARGYGVISTEKEKNNWKVEERMRETSDKYILQSQFQIEMKIPG